MNGQNIRNPQSAIRNPQSPGPRPAITAIIPARYASTRLPGKPLIDIAGKPMILHVVQRAREVSLINRVIVATDDQRVLKAVVEAGEEAILTSPDHRTGTDRLAEVAADLEDEIIVNVQGDEPLIEAATIEAAIAPLLADPSIVLSTTCEPIESVEDILDPSVVKVVVDQEGFAIYFSRNPIPFPREAVLEHGSVEKALRAQPELSTLYSKHTGLYAYRREFLLTFTGLVSTKLERVEALEQLRALEHGFKIKVVPVAQRSIGVDTPEDLERVRRVISEKV
jgi:3-deoxy-manno-octulosonate cytidylyltransferase (CMP-KDO synthetase)